VEDAKMRVEVPLPDILADAPAAAREAEALGYDSAGAQETAHNPFLNCLMALEHTERLRVGTAIAVAFPRSPMVVANLCWDLAAYSGGRFTLGLGTQIRVHNERRFSTQWLGPPGPRLREYILALRAIFDCWQNGSRLSFRGEHYQFSLMTPFFNPGPIEHPQIPVYISAVNPYNCETVGLMCDGIRLHPFNTPTYLREVIVPNVEKGARQAGRSLADIDLVGGGFVITGETPDEIEAQKPAVKQHIAFYASTPAYYPVLETHGWQEIGPKLNDLSKRGKWQEMGDLISDDMLEEIAVVARLDDVVERAKSQWGGVVTTFVFSIPARTDREKGRLRELIAELKKD
jgi:probable F420-dependent oxidoreductase